MRNNKKSGRGIWFLIIISIIFAGYILVSDGGKTEEMHYSQLVQQINEDKIEEITLEGRTVTVKPKNSDVNYKTVIPSIDAFQEDAGETLKRNNVSYRVEEETTSVWSMIFPVITFLIIGGFLLMLIKGQTNKGASFTKSRARLNSDLKNKVGFDSVAGAVEEKEELSEIVEFLKNPSL